MHFLSSDNDGWNLPANLLLEMLNIPTMIDYITTSVKSSQLIVLNPYRSHLIPPSTQKNPPSSVTPTRKFIIPT